MTASSSGSDRRKRRRRRLRYAGLGIALLATLALDRRLRLAFRPDEADDEPEEGES